MSEKTMTMDEMKAAMDKSDRCKHENLESNCKCIDCGAFILRPYFANEVLENMDSIRRVFGADFASAIESKAHADVFSNTQTTM